MQTLDDAPQEEAIVPGKVFDVPGFGRICQPLEKRDLLRREERSCSGRGLV